VPDEGLAARAHCAPKLVPHKGGGLLPILTFQIGRGYRDFDLIEQATKGLACRVASAGFTEVEKVADNVSGLLVGFVGPEGVATT
jgi:hypothetical protein